MKDGKRLGSPQFQRGSRHYRVLEEISAGDLFVGFLFSAKSTRSMYKIARARATERYRNRLAIERLEGCGYVQRQSRNGKIAFFITREGKRALRDIYERSARAVKHPEKWDGVWRVIAYDFPEKERATRNSLRYVLHKSHFLRIQKSVWVFPYDCSLLSELLAKNATANAHTIFMKVASISSESTHKKHFGLA